jgi:hypothetical protein
MNEGRIRCLWCERDLRPRARGRQPSRFCSKACKDEYNSTIRSLADHWVRSGKLSVQSIKKLSTTLGLANRRQR